MKITTEYQSGILRISLHGELDHHEAKNTMDKISEAMDVCLPREVCLDMSDMSFMDSSGIAVILKASKKLRITKGKMLIESPQAQPMKVLEAAGIGSIVPIVTKWEVTT